MKEETLHNPSMSQLRWRCRRGMRELDVVLERFLDQQYPQAEAAVQEAFHQVLLMQDPDLYACLLGRIEPPAELADIIAQLHTSR